MTAPKKSLSQKHAAAAKKKQREDAAYDRWALKELNRQHPGLPHGHTLDMDSIKFSKLIQKDGETVALFTRNSGTFTRSKHDVAEALPTFGAGEYFENPNFAWDIALQDAWKQFEALEPLFPADTFDGVTPPKNGGATFARFTSTHGVHYSLSQDELIQQSASIPYTKGRYSEIRKVFDTALNAINAFNEEQYKKSKAAAHKPAKPATAKSKKPVAPRSKRAPAAKP